MAIPRNALAIYTWSCSFGWCLADGWGNRLLKTSAYPRDSRL